MFNQLAKWSTDHYSHLPWRVNRSVYGTLVSEIMLQQTTVGTVINHFDRFLKKYPNIESLAKTTEEQILIDWKGLGYYRRARNLLKAAKEIQDKFNGVIPKDYESLISINGIGPYTANALIAIGSNKAALCVDANLERVLARYYGLRIEKGPKLQKEIYRLFTAGDISTEISEVGARVYNEALMDLGRSICKARSASCEICPLSIDCQALKSAAPLEFPVQSNTDEKKKNLELTLLRIIVEKNGKYLVYKKSDQQWLSGQYEIPTFVLESDDKDLKQYPRLNVADHIFYLPSFSSGITKYKINNCVLHASEKDLIDLNIPSSQYEWKTIEENLSVATLKAIKL